MAVNTAQAVGLVEGLESRVHLSVGPVLRNEVLAIAGTNRAANVIVVERNGDDATKLDVTFNGATTQYAVDDVSKILVFGGRHGDRIEIREDNGAVAIKARFLGRGGDDTIIGGSGDDFIMGGRGHDLIAGNGGKDLLFGLFGSDTISGGGGDDGLFGGVGHDVLSGNDGNDWLLGGNGGDRVEGGAGADKLSGGAGNDALFGGDGSDIILALVGADSVVSGEGFDIVKLGRKATAEHDPGDWT